MSRSHSASRDSSASYLILNRSTRNIWLGILSSFRANVKIRDLSNAPNCGGLDYSGVFSKALLLRTI